MNLCSGHDRMVVPNSEIVARDDVRTFAFPVEVVEDPSLSVAEKRAILAEWASDRSAVESYPTLRQLPGTTFPVTFSSIMEARDSLDQLVGSTAMDDPEHEQLGRVVVANFARSCRNDGLPQ